MDARVREYVKEIKEKYGGGALFDEPLRDHSTIRIGGPAECLYMPVTYDELSELAGFLKAENVAMSVLGNGSNVLLPDDGVRGVVVILKGGDFSKISYKGDEVTSGAGVQLVRLLYDCCARGL